jgi:LysM repeat protein
MRKLALWALVVSTLLACGTLSFGNQGSDVEIDIPSGDESNLIPTASVPETVEEEATATEAPRIPPTWTPVSGSNVGLEAGSGDSENLPVSSTAVPSIVPGAETYTVQPGDTLANIAFHFGVTVFELAEANNIENIDLIEVGQVLIIP